MSYQLVEQPSEFGRFSLLDACSSLHKDIQNYTSEKVFFNMLEADNHEFVVTTINKTPDHFSLWFPEPIPFNHFEGRGLSWEEREHNLLKVLRHFTARDFICAPRFDFKPYSIENLSILAEQYISMDYESLEQEHRTKRIGTSRLIAFSNKSNFSPALLVTPTHVSDFRAVTDQTLKERLFGFPASVIRSLASGDSYNMFKITSFNKYIGFMTTVLASADFPALSSLVT